MTDPYLLGISCNGACGIAGCPKCDTSPHAGVTADVTIRPGDLPVAKLEQASLAEIEAAAQPTQPFDDALKARIAEISATGKRVHLMACPGTAYLTGARVYEAFPSSKAAFGWSLAQARTV